MSEPIQAIATNNYLLATPIGSGYMEASALEYDGDKISGYSGSAFAGGTDLDFGYDESGAISSINTSALSDSRAGTPLYVEYPLYTGQSGDSAYIGWQYETKLFESETTAGSNAQVFTLSEPYTAFERIKVFFKINDGDAGSTEALTCNSHIDCITMGAYQPKSDARISKALRYYLVNDNQLSASPTAIFNNFNGGAWSTETYTVFYVQQILGINRKRT